MLDIFRIDRLFFTFWGYPMSHIEFWATMTGAVAVWLSVRENVWSWVIGLTNVLLAFGLFYQIQLYPDMFLQVFFFVTNILGFWYWKFPKNEEKNKNNELIISKLNPRNFLIYSLLALLFTGLFGTFSQHLHQIFPRLFSLPSAFPFVDSFTTIMSIYATFLLMRKKVEAWWIWLAVDILSTYMYYIKEVKLYAFLYLIFCLIAAQGAWSWTKQYQQQKKLTHS